MWNPLTTFSSGGYFLDDLALEHGLKISEEMPEYGTAIDAVFEVVGDHSVSVPQFYNKSTTNLMSVFIRTNPDKSGHSVVFLGRHRGKMLSGQDGFVLIWGGIGGILLKCSSVSSSFPSL